jgi:2-C-methyl-D-erythritol 2,4-cyclodiphosphate synthase
MQFRIGSGHDSHRFIAGRPLRLAGVTVPHSRGLDGHSDADIVLHALTDAILGALALGDIGELFPDTDPAHRGADSRIFLDEALRQMRQAGFSIGNLDVTIFAQEPKLSPYKLSLREQLSVLCGVGLNQVSVKAKTGERVRHIGRAEAMACHVVVLLWAPAV